MHESAQPGDPFPTANAEDTIAATDPSSVAGAVGAVGDNSNGSRALDERELDSALQLLVERAQYITGATGTALALPRGEEMVCRASAGASAPAVGARLQVRSGLTGESIARRQLLRCDNAESDPRVNLEACRALGIASIVVLPLLRRNGEVRGLFELFSDHPYAFEERDLIALERMADLTLTALDLAEKRQDGASPAATPSKRDAGKAAGVLADVAKPSSTGSSEPTNESIGIGEPGVSTPAQVELAPATPVTPPVTLSSSSPITPVTAAAVPEAILRVQRCASCGFPVSEGRSLCLDCEKKERDKKDGDKKNEETPSRAPVDNAPSVSSDSVPPVVEEFVPAFLANSAAVKESWLSNHVNLLALIVLILGILVAVVVFR